MVQELQPVVGRPELVAAGTGAVVARIQVNVLAPNPLAAEILRKVVEKLAVVVAAAVAGN